MKMLYHASRLTVTYTSTVALHTRRVFGPRVPGLNGYPGTEVVVRLRSKSREWQLIIPYITSPGYYSNDILQEETLFKMKMLHHASRLTRLCF